MTGSVCRDGGHDGRSWLGGTTRSEFLRRSEGHDASAPGSGRSGRSAVGAAAGVAGRGQVTDCAREPAAGCGGSGGGRPERGEHGADLYLAQGDAGGGGVGVRAGGGGAGSAACGRTNAGAGGCVRGIRHNRDRLALGRDSACQRPGGRGGAAQRAGRTWWPVMFGPPPGTRVYLACGATDMRKGFDGLAAQVQTVLSQDPYSGAVFCFRGRRGDLLKILVWDGQGLVLVAKRLEKGRFVWPQATSGVVSLTPAMLSMLLEGIDWRMPAWTARPEVVG